MTCLDEKLVELKERGETGFFPFLTTGFTSIELTKRLLRELSNGLADGFELGIPYSDPMADGPSIQYASEWALKEGVKTGTVMDIVKEVAPVSNPIILMTYYNVVLRAGPEQFAVNAVQAGASGVIIPDLAIEEAGSWIGIAAAQGLNAILMVAPTSTDERIRSIAELSTGFIYCVSLRGVTGARTELPPEVPQLIAKIKKHTDKPVVVGFGVSSGEHAKALRGIADGVIVGSAMVNAIKAGATDDERESNVKAMATEIMTGLGRI